MEITTVHLKLFATLGKFLPEGGERHVQIQPGATVSNLLSQLSIPESDAKLIFINGRRANLETVLKGGERLGIFPPVGGG